jgi:SAM-dependent methyltransferase
MNKEKQPDHRQIFEAEIRPIEDTKERFTRIYRINMWGAEDGITETVSGPGSTLSHTEGIREDLPVLFQTFGISSVLDAGCGDFNWMQGVIAKSGVNYIGVDLVDELIQANQQKFGSDTVNFLSLDITRDDLPTADLVICRECLFHLSLDQIHLFLNNFLRSQSEFLLTTNYGKSEIQKNQDVETGFFREIDLTAEPFNLPDDFLYSIKDTSLNKPVRNLCLWKRDQLVDLYQ